MRLSDSLKCPGLEQALAAIPEVFSCPRCGAEVEIWSDEKQRKCPSCGGWVKKDGGEKRVEAAPAERPVKVEVLNFSDEAGAAVFYERYETEVPGGCFEHNKKYKIACEACPTYGKNLACPPFSPTFQDYLGKFTRARAICIRLPMAYFAEVPPESRYRACFRQARALLTKELLEWRRRGFEIAGSGPCLACAACRVEDGPAGCLKPSKRVYSLESLGVNLLSLAAHHLHVNLEWSTDDRFADFVCAIGAVFFPSAI